MEKESSAAAPVGQEMIVTSRSPDRADAMVWAMTELAESRPRVARVRML